MGSDNMVRSFGHIEMGIYERTLKESLDGGLKNIDGNQFNTFATKAR